MRGHIEPEALASLSSEVVDALLDAEGHPGEANLVIHRAIGSGWVAGDIYLSVLPKVWHDIGERWHHGLISVAEEHLATGVIQSTMRDLARLLPRSPRTGRSIAIAAVVGERHDNGPQMVADLLDASGWDVIFAGAATPTNGFVQLISERRPDAVGLGITGRENLAALTRAVTAIKTRISDPPFILVGGQGAPADAAFAASIGADASASTADEAVLALNRWIGVHGEIQTGTPVRAADLGP
ncbi:MAG: cobalamin-dependent protein [Candidatus Limnocylindrales bacterium]